MSNDNDNDNDNNNNNNNLFNNEENKFGFHHYTEQIRKDSKNIYNRLKSIYEDSKFISEISNLLPYLPVIANERCGNWYIDQKLCAQSAYFKSTDGHIGNWDFNIRRLNAHLLDIIIKYNGCIIVDSTRRGKRLPDSLSKTVPIWCCTINLAIKEYRDSLKKVEFEFEESIEWDTEFHSLSSVISNSEHSQISSLIPQFAQKLINSDFDLNSLSNKLKKPLRPLWFTPSSNLYNLPDYTSMSFYPVICLSASKMVANSEEKGMERRDGFLYIQGSADDHEMWSMSLTSSQFWKYQKEILDTNDPIECEKKVKEIVTREKTNNNNNYKIEEIITNDSFVDTFNFIGNSNIAIGNYKSAFPSKCWSNFDYIINCTPESPPLPPTSSSTYPYYNHNNDKDNNNNDDNYDNKYLQLSIPEGKKGQNKLFSSIPIALGFVKKPLEEKKRILIHCKVGIDRSVGICLAILINYFDDEGNFIKEGINHNVVTKELIQKRLLLITKYRIKANPTRATLKKINNYFMSNL
ncbi:hypothetical protein Glove_134g83 [Diversispora epigaea]|uniref:Uncharacterized protein n=1 Tax=Diversispora epigaea TaxID=1348612 RepID=A0A397IX18_9GLOM|nr:hypothetical protein Glove_134g83 [Diversispora epigaea]